MKLLNLKKVKDGKYLKNYEMTYLNKKGKEKVYEIVSRHEIADEKELGNHVSGVSVVAYCEDKLLLLKEFRMGINRYVYNLCAGMIEAGESIE
ncbi:MAG: NUDIX hydrolase, partial [Lachnospiraceae bacterium]|nr:NUDIX hydrolase [Lachnospiraceae bacterium]